MQTTYIRVTTEPLIRQCNLNRNMRTLELTENTTWQIMSRTRNRRAYNVLLRGPRKSKASENKRRNTLTR